MTKEKRILKISERKMEEPSCTIYLNKKNGQFILEGHAIESKFGWCASYGALIFVSREEMGKRGIDIVLQDLQEFSQRCGDEKSEHENMTASERSTFDRKHKNVGITLISSDSLRLFPMHKEQGGHIGNPGEEVYVKLPVSSEEFFQKLMEAFDKC